MGKKQKTHEEFLAEIADRPFKVLDRYVTSKTPIMFRCLVDGHEWLTKPNTVLSGRGCPVCGRRKVSESKLQTNTILEDHGDWLLIDCSTPCVENSVCKIDRDVFDSTRGRVMGTQRGYAKVWDGKKWMYLHQYILPDAIQVDHINRDKSDNRRRNLRACEWSDNAKNMPVQKNNTSGVPGVSWSKRDAVWFSQIGYNNKNIHLGTFKNKDDAIKARKEAEQKYFGEFAPKHKIIPEKMYEKV